MIAQEPLVSVIIPVYNGERFLPAALDSVFAQDYRPLEVIVVDDGSTDRTAEVMRAYTEVRYISQMNQGHGAARNRAISICRGDFIAFLDADDLWLPHKLRIQVEYLQRHPQILYTVTHMKFLSEPGHALRPGFKPDTFAVEQIGCTPSALVARRTTFERIGVFNPDLRIGCDADWFARARDHAIPMSVIAELLVYKRIHQANLSADVRTNKEELIAVMRQSIERKRKRIDHGDA